MKIYKAEAEIAHLIKNNSTALFAPVVSLENKVSDEKHKKVMAAFSLDKNFDVYFINSILASVGKNQNDDVFLPSELWAAKDTPVYKQFNYMHNEKDIIGCIIKSGAVDKNGNPIIDDAKASEVNDIITQAVIWTYWDDPELSSRMENILQRIEANELFVSMECLFREFDYQLSNAEETKIVQRSDDTAFLSKSLKIYGGDGKYENYEVSRVLRNYVFSGKGLVDNPANPRSVIDFTVSTASNNQENIMNLDELQAELDKTKAELKKTNDEFAAFKKSQAEDESHKAEVDGLNKQIAELKRVIEEYSTKFDSAKASASDKLKEVSDLYEAVKAENESLKAEAVKSARIAKLVAVKVSEDRALEICETFAGVNDAQFDELVKTYAALSEKQSSSLDFDNVDAKKMEDKEESEAESMEDEDEMDKSKCSEADNKFKSIAAEIGEILSLKTKE
jgi:hypothetical protein